MLKNLTLIFVLSLFFTELLISQTYPITDRSFAYATAYTMPSGVGQIEGGYFSVRELEMEDGLSISGFQSLFRYGISGSSEVRATLGYNSLSAGPERFTGVSGLKLGIKTGLVEEGQYLPAISFLAEAELPDIGSIDFRPAIFTPSMRFIVEKYLNDVWIIGTNLGWTWTESAPRFNYSLSLRTALTDEIALYTEFYGSNSKFTAPRDFVDVALEFWVMDRVALDVVIGWGITDGADGGFISIGGGVTL